MVERHAIPAVVEEADVPSWVPRHNLSYISLCTISKVYVYGMITHTCCCHCSVNIQNGYVSTCLQVCDQPGTPCTSQHF